MKLTEHFTWDEAVNSPVAQEHRVSNEPPTDEVRAAILFTAAGMERLRSFLANTPIQILSWYRCKELNELVGGSVNSQHMKGEAVDFTCTAFGGPRSIVAHLFDNLPLIGIDQLILEPRWVHVSFTHSPRYEILTASNGKYLPGFV